MPVVEHCIVPRPGAATRLELVSQRARTCEFQCPPRIAHLSIVTVKFVHTEATNISCGLHHFEAPEAGRACAA